MDNSHEPFFSTFDFKDDVKGTPTEASNEKRPYTPNVSEEDLIEQKRIIACLESNVCPMCGNDVMFTKWNGFCSPECFGDTSNGAKEANISQALAKYRHNKTLSEDDTYEFGMIKKQKEPNDTQEEEEMKKAA